MKTIICHFYNEEMLLPYWLRHHNKLFDHGILIDYESTDNSVEIIKNYTPNWDIVKSKNKHFAAKEVDLEVMEIENSINGWKIVLNVTEFLMIRNLQKYIDNFEKQFPNKVGVRTEAVYPFDRPEEIGKPFDDRDLWQQRTYGFFETIASEKYKTKGVRHRLLHKAKNGAYEVGRHETKHKVSIDENLFLFCIARGILGLKKDRNIKISKRIPKEDKEKGLGVHHLWNEEQIEKNYYAILPWCQELMGNENYKITVEELSSL